MAKKKNTPIDSSTGGTDQPTNDEKKRTRKSRKQKTMDDLSIVDNKKDEYHTCSICGRKSNEVSTMICNADANVYVCSDCIENIYELAMSREAQLRGDLDPVRKFREEDSDDSDVMFNSNIPTPHQIKEYLDQYVIGQDDAKITLSVAVYNHYKRIMQKVDENDENAVTIEKNNIIICGNSGSGKTYLLKTIAKFLNVPICINSATELTASGFVGTDVEELISRLYTISGNDVEKTQMGICVIDEFDKLASHSSGNIASRDVNGLDVQQGLLKLLEGTEVYIETGNRRGPEVEKLRILTDKILFIAVGKFAQLEDAIRKRLNQNQMGFDLTNGKDQEGNLIDSENVVKYAEPEDFRKCGFIQEIVGRLPVITYVNPLTKEDLKRILLEPKNSIIKQYKKLFELSGKQLIIKDDVYDYIVAKGFKTNSGARGLRNVVENILKQKMFDSPSEPDKEVLIDMDYVRKVESKNFIDPSKIVEVDKKRKITL